MKLYTEEQIKSAMLSSFLTGVSRPPFYEEYEEAIFNSLNPIELPSDEEIEDYAIDVTSLTSGYAKTIAQSYYQAGAKWMKEQILNQNK